MKIIRIKPMQKADLNIFHQGFVRWSYLPNWYDNIRNFFYNFKYGWQRMTRGYSDRDLWDLNSWHSNLMADALNTFRKNTHGYPGTITEDEWDSILATMAENFWRCEESNDAFETDVDEECDRLFWTDTEEINLQRYKLINQAREKSMDQAFELFHRWYFYLWD